MTNPVPYPMMDPLLVPEISKLNEKIDRSARILAILYSRTGKRSKQVCGIKLITRDSIIQWSALQSVQKDYTTNDWEWFYLRDCKYKLVDIKPCFTWH